MDQISGLKASMISIFVFGGQFSQYLYILLDPFLGGLEVGLIGFAFPLSNIFCFLGF